MYFYLQKDDGATSPGATSNENGTDPSSPITAQPESKNTPIVLGPPPSSDTPPAPAPRPDNSSSRAEAEKAPLYTAEEKPQLYDGYGY